MAKALATNAAELVRRMNRRKAAVEGALKAAARQLAPEMVAATKGIIQDQIYSVPIPLTADANRRLAKKATVRTKTTKGKHGKWQRTGNLKRSETAVADSADVVMRNNAAYGMARHALGGPNPPNKSGRKAGEQRAQPGVPDAEKSKTKSVQWQSEAVEAKRSRVVQVRRIAVLRALSSP